MESRRLSTLLSSLISQLFLLLFLLFNSDSDSDSIADKFPFVIHHFLSSQESSIALSLRKNNRKRSRSDLGEAFNGGFPRRRSPDEFKTSFGMTASTFEWLAASLEPLLDCRDPISAPLGLSTELRLAIGLFRLSTGSDYAKISRRFGVAEESARFCAKQLCRVLCTDFRFWVNLLGSSEITGFGIPNCAGVISCVRFPVAGEDSVAAQIVVDSDSRILSIVAGFRGEGKSDRKILELTNLSGDVEEKRVLNSGSVLVNGVVVDPYFVSNGDYSLLPWLMVRFEQASPGSGEACFNEAVDQARIPAVSAIVSLRNWGVLRRPLEEVKSGVAYIGACSILHNALLMRGDDSGLADESEARSWLDRSDNSGSNGNAKHEKACVVRDALAMYVKEICSTKREGDLGG